MKNLAFALIISLLPFSQVESQTESKFWEKKNTFGFLSAGTNYSNKANLFGTFNPSVRQSSVITYVSFYTKNQTDLMLTGIYTTNADTSLTLSTTIFGFSAGKEFTLNENFSVNFLFDKYFYQETQNSLNPNYTDVLSASLSYNPKILWADIQLDVLNADRTDFSLSASLSPELTIEKLFHHALSASVMPYASLNMATRKYIQTAYDQLLEKPVSSLQYFTDAENIWATITNNVSQKLSDLENNRSGNIDPVLRNTLRRNLINTESEAYLNQLLNQEEADGFGLNSIILSVPVTLYIANFGVGFSYSWYFPMYDSELFSANKTQYFSADITYIKTIDY
ncbi:MAG: hypothetical protein GVY19_09570 [Bacteroidetes bacterium]|jgi:hypothetical protein|nr:hypothetical protein [Bacteroidota bacterium]